MFGVQRRLAELERRLEHLAGSVAIVEYRGGKFYFRGRKWDSEQAMIEEMTLHGYEKFIVDDLFDEPLSAAVLTPRPEAPARAPRVETFPGSNMYADRAKKDAGGPQEGAGGV